MNLSIEFKHRRISGRVTLAASNSISTRVLVIRALLGGGLPVENLSDSDDTNVMRRILDSGDSRFDVGHAGTAMRFLTAFFARTPGEWEITGSERMKRRPIGILVEALNCIGARISYAEEAGSVSYTPLRANETK
ncbi:MAG: 3-phosphoshikimate 1-carboxyvinyltransferase, partial [Odoribacter sp.]|nr:3-phosphoshikimate 1-carboxyvinyltransferase [Odoribacter sp.]